MRRREQSACVDLIVSIAVYGMYPIIYMRESAGPIPVYLCNRSYLVVGGNFSTFRDTQPDLTSPFRLKDATKVFHNRSLRVKEVQVCRVMYEV